ncbi:MFS general substrate transporter [Trichodelitschia bisporula]|uniref:MFS general substrate transporter n=1 Tax=Trichodelitschia bisporula TaxID=703511 RepID=A0A6G1HQ95_9PEZI|nr:MFS general substrate transporter [Trichodelitschia bisporula]
MSLLSKPFKWLYHEFGLSSVTATGRDAQLIILTRCCRMFAYGTNSLMLALFFSALGFADYQIGLFMTLTLLGDVLLSLFLTLIADRVGRRRVLLAGSALMVMSGATFALSDNFWILLLAAVIGVISATGGDFGPFRAIEESTLSHLTGPKTRSDVLSWYVMMSSMGSSLGTEVSGRVITWLQARDGWSLPDAYHAIFWVYTGMGLVNAILVWCLSDACELQTPSGSDEAAGILLVSDSESDDEGSSTPAPAPAKKKSGFFSLFAAISPRTRTTMYKLWFLLIVDSLADGMVPYSLTNYYMDRKFHLPASTLGDVTSASYVLSSVGTAFAAPLARRLGLINTMVFTHIPSSLAVLVFPAPPGVVLTVILLFIRTGLNNMDQAPRSAFIAAVVLPEERTAVMGITSMLRTLASTAGPTVTGVLAGNDRFWIAFVAAGALRLAYDLGLWAMFVNMRVDGDRKEEGNDVQMTEVRKKNGSTV